MHKKEARAILICGFLGSGKTTLLREILSWKKDLRDTAVIVNEFGDVGIDGELLKDRGSNVIELTSGCICCTIQVDLRNTLIQLFDKYQPSWLLIEATGLADPVSIIPVFSNLDMKERVSLFKVITVLDAEYWKCRDIFGPLFESQLGHADTILVNKVDLLSQEEVPSLLESISNAYPSKQIIPTVYAKVDPDLIFLPSSRVQTFPSDVFPIISRDHYHDTHTLMEAISFKGYTSFVFTDEVRFNFECLKNTIFNFPLNIFRIKGWFVSDSGTFFINIAGGKGILEKVQDEVPNKIVFIGWNMDSSFIQKKLNGCII
ncbi:MAG: CobW family GTP-binding protein [Brevinematales bacterium]